MADTYEIFGHRIVVHHQLTFEEQIRDVMVEEIHNGRWEVGDRLPGILALAKGSGFGTKTMYNAFEKLREEGYVEMRGNRGTFLKARSPNINAKGKIGVLLKEEQRSMQLILWYQHIILEAAAKRGMITEVKVLPTDMEPNEALLEGRIFAADVQGVISLFSFGAGPSFLSKDAILPHVFLCPPYESGVPRVCADVEYAYYELTHRMIEAGHRSVGFSYESFEMDARQAEMHLSGYRRAMAERGLAVDEELIGRSKTLRNDQLVDVSAYLQELVDLPEERRPTAMICGSLGRTTVLTNVAPLRGVEIPARLSVASIGTAAVTGKEGGLMTGMLPDFDKMMDACFAVLDEYAEQGGISKTEVMMLFRFVPGVTMRETSGAGGATRSESVVKTALGIDAMSEAVHF